MTRTNLTDEVVTALCQLADDDCPHHHDSDEGPALNRPAKKVNCCRHAKTVWRLRRQLWHWKRRARTDVIGLLNRPAIEGIAKAKTDRRDQATEALALVLIDLDNFKEINNRFLHPGGDQALAGVAQALTAALRPGDRLGRYGGDEFLLVAPLDVTGAAALAERIIAEVCRAAISYGGHEIRVSVSIGLAVADAGVPADYAQLLHVAAQALRDAKHGGKSRHVIRQLSSGSNPVPAGAA